MTSQAPTQGPTDAGLTARVLSSEWQTMDTAPRDGARFLAFGSYQYPEDAHPTEYMEIVEFSFNDEYPWLDVDGQNKPEVYSNWMPLPTPPPIPANRKPLDVSRRGFRPHSPQKAMTR